MAKNPAAASASRLITANKRARFEFHILEELECGIVLKGTEVKALREGRCSIQEAWAGERKGELFLIGMHIPEYKHGNIHNHLPTRDRKLLAHKKEIEAWALRTRDKGVTIIALAIAFKGSRVKITLGLCKGKKLHDKRADTREREDKREMERATARRR